MDSKDKNSKVKTNTESSDSKKDCNKDNKARGKGSTRRREEKRLPARAKYEAEQITADTLKRLGIESTEFDVMKPALNEYAGGVHVNLLSANSAVNEMLDQTIAVAPRSLALLLQDEANIRAYRKVASYAMTARVAHSQVEAPFITGNDLEMEHAFKASDYQLMANYFAKIPQFLAWLLSNLGRFTQDGTTTIPLLPYTSDGSKVTIDQAMSGNALSVSQYVTMHLEGAPGVMIPPDERPQARLLARHLPLTLNPGSTRFTAANATRYARPITADEYSRFDKLNRAMNELNFMTHFDFLDKKGTPVPTVRIPKMEVNELVGHDYYSSVVQNPQNIRAALILKYGLDQFIPVEQQHDRYVSEPDVALVRGNDSPAPLLAAQLFMCRRQRENAK